MTLPIPSRSTTPGGAAYVALGKGEPIEMT